MPCYYYLFTFIGIIAILAVAGVLRPTGETISTSPIDATTTSHTAAIDTYLIPVLKKESVIEAMDSYAATGAFAYAAHSYPSLGLFIDSIGGKKNGGGKYWILYVNGKSSDLGASSAIVSPGDIVEWRYEKSY